VCVGVCEKRPLTRDRFTDAERNADEAIA